MSYRMDKLVIDAHTDGRTHTDAGNDNIPRKIAKSSDFEILQKALHARHILNSLVQNQIW